MRNILEKPGKGPTHVAQCATPSDVGWTIIGYKYSADVPMRPETAKLLLDRIKVKRTSPPSVDVAGGPKQKPHPGSQKQQKRRKPELQLDGRARALEEQLPQKIAHARQNAEAAQRTGRYFGAALLLGGIGLFVVGGIAHRQNAAKRTSRLFYELDETQRQKFSTVQQALTHLSKSERIWRIDADTATSDWKRHAAASSLVRRRLITIDNSFPPRVETNVPVPCIKTCEFRLFFMPDLILLFKDGRFGGVSYDDFRVQQSSTRFIENGYLAADATVVGRTWRYVNKNGGPDRRFNNNAQLPILQYGVLVLTSSRGLNILCKRRVFNRASRMRTAGVRSRTDLAQQDNRSRRETESHLRIRARRIGHARCWAGAIK